MHSYRALSSESHKTKQINNIYIYREREREIRIRHFIYRDCTALADTITDAQKEEHPKLCGDCQSHGLLDLRRKAERMRHRSENSVNSK